MKLIGKLLLSAALFGTVALFGAAGDYEENAEKGDSKAQYNLGVCYFKGDGVKQDFAKSAEWFKKSSDQGYGHAQCFLALCYTFGKGVKQDHAEALLPKKISPKRSTTSVFSTKPAKAESPLMRRKPKSGI